MVLIIVLRLQYIPVGRHSDPGPSDSVQYEDLGKNDCPHTASSVFPIIVTTTCVPRFTITYGRGMVT